MVLPDRTEIIADSIAQVHRTMLSEVPTQRQSDW